MSFKGWLLFIVIAVVAYCWAILPVTANAAFVLAGLFGLDADIAVPIGFVFSTVFIVACIVWGVIGANK
jgi:hypothetical protein